MNGIREYLARSSAAVSGLDPAEVGRAADLVAECIGSGGTVFLCGNGGSAADSLHLAAGEAEHLAGLAERVTPAPVVKVPVQPFEVSDLESLRTLAAVVFADTSDGYGAGDSDAQQAHD